MKKIGCLAILALMASGVSYAYTSDKNENGFYAGVQLGYADMHYDSDWLTQDSYFTSVDSVDSKGMAGRIHIGYDFNKYFALEMGYLILPKVKFNNINNLKIDESFTQNILDFFAKGTLSLNYGFDLYAKAGLAGVRRGDIEVSSGGTTLKSDDTNNKTVGAFGIGADYRITDHIFVDAGYTRYLGTGDLKPTDFVALGIAYRF